MTFDAFHDFFVASAGVAGALIGLLFVAVSVTRDRLSERGDTQIHRVRASAALTSFTNALLVSLFGLIPDENLGGVAIAVGILGVGFVGGAVLSIIRVRHLRWSDARELGFLGGLTVAFVVQIVIGFSLSTGHRTMGNAEAIATIVVVSFLFGVSRSWELIGGPSIGLKQEISERIMPRPVAADDQPREADAPATESTDTDPPLK